MRAGYTRTSSATAYFAQASRAEGSAEKVHCERRSEARIVPDCVLERSLQLWETDSEGAGCRTCPGPAGRCA
eukprot:1157964-Rhodomonas_salina.1